MMCFLLIIWFDVTRAYRQTKAHNRAMCLCLCVSVCVISNQIQGLIDWHTHINVYQHYLLCAHSNYLYYIEWIIGWYQKFTLTSFTMSLLFKNYQLVEVTCLLTRCHKTKFFPWNTKNTEKHGANKQSTHHHSLRER